MGLWINTLALGGIAGAYLSNRYAWWRPAFDYQSPRILMYHMVAPHRASSRYNGMRVRPENFSKQIEWLAGEGWHFVTVSELLQSWNSGPKKQVAITFDDGYEDNFLNAFPVLKRFNAKATLYLVIDRFDRDWAVYKKKKHNSGELAREPKLSDQQVGAMLESGLVEIGGHTRTHANLNQVPSSQAEDEISSAKADLEKQFDIRIQSFAYPFGLYQPEHVEMVKRAGFNTAVTTRAGIDSPDSPDFLQLSRVKISGKDNHLAFTLKMKTGRRGWRK